MCVFKQGDNWWYEFDVARQYPATQVAAGPRIYEPAGNVDRDAVVWRHVNSEVVPAQNLGVSVANMDTSSNFRSAKILCVEFNLAVRESRCAVLKHSGYDALSAAPHLAESVLRSQKFDLVVLSMLCDLDSHLIDGLDILVLDGFTMPAELLSLVTQRLNSRQRRASAAP
jgi:hypothetical protein